VCGSNLKKKGTKTANKRRKNPKLETFKTKGGEDASQNVESKPSKKDKGSPWGLTVQKMGKRSSEGKSGPKDLRTQNHEGEKESERGQVEKKLFSVRKRGGGKKTYCAVKQDWKKRSGKKQKEELAVEYRTLQVDTRESIRKKRWESAGGH